MTISVVMFCCFFAFGALSGVKYQDNCKAININK